MPFHSMPSPHSRLTHPVAPSLFPTRLLSASLLLLGLAGCATGDIAMLAEIAGGEKIRVPFTKGGTEMTNLDGVQINTATFTLNPDKKILHVFEFTDSRNRPLRSVRVEDVSDATAVTLVEDAAPKSASGGRWRGEVPPVDLADSRLAWMATISNSLRVYRFTLTFADGRTLVLLQGSFYPAGMKAAVRQALGQNY